MPQDNATQQKPVGPFEDFEACVAHFQGDEEVDDPEALCGWMEENQGKTAVQEYQPDAGEVEELVQAMKDPATSSVLTDLEVSFVSGVEDPAQDSQWVMAKDAQQEGADWGVNAPLVLQKGTAIALDEAQADDGPEQQKAWAPVLIPNETDKQGDVIPPEAIEKAAHRFVSEFRNIDTDHDLLEGKGTPIESWTLKEESTFTLPDGSDSRQYPKGTWMMGVKFADEAWKRIKDGELSGFSIYGEATEHSVAELLGDDTDLAMGAQASAPQAAAKEADSESDTMENDTDSGAEGEFQMKELPEDAVQMLAGSVDAMLAAEDAEPDEVPLGEFVQWALDNGEFATDSVVIGGVEYTAEGAGGDGTEGDGEEPDEETPPGGEEMEAEMENTENTEDSPSEGETSTKELLEDVRDTVKSTQESVEQHGDRIEALEDAVFEKEQGPDHEGEGEGQEAAAPDSAEVEQAASEAAEDEVKSLLGIEELPDDPDERQEIVRKHLHEEPQDGDTVGNPDSWTEDEVSEVVR